MPLLATRGAASAQGFGEFAQSAGPVYIEDVFSTYLYTGNGSTQTVTNGIDFSGKGGLLWLKRRDLTGDNALFDTARGATSLIYSNLTNAAQATGNAGNPTDLLSFNSAGFSLTTPYYTNINNNGSTIASWSFREQPKFFDVVTYTGNGTAGRTVAHNLGSVPGCIIVKRTDQGGSNWRVYHRSLGATYYLGLDETNAALQSTTIWNDTAPTSTVFSVGTSSNMNASGGTYVAYLFAHDAGGFGLASDQNVITCNSFTTDGSGNATVSLGYEPQWLLIKKSSSTDGGVSDRWHIYDTVRGIPTGAADRALDPNNDFAEYSTNFLELTATGFNVINSILPASQTFVYVAIRRGPMEAPTTGTEVFYPYVTTSTSNVGSSSGTMYNSQILSDSAWQKAKSSGDGWYLGSRMTATAYMKSETTAAGSTSAAIVWDSNRGTWAFSDASYGLYCFKRAPSFHDVICYTGNGSQNRNISHNLGVAPQLIISRIRNDAATWNVYSEVTGTSNRLVLNTDSGFQNIPIVNSTSATTYNIGNATSMALNTNGFPFIAYLFATCPGVSKVGSYTGTGTTLQVNCGFTTGARFVMIKRTDDNATGGWYVWDSARGITSSSAPYLLLNSAAAESSSTYIEAYSAGFQVNSGAPAELNASGGTYLFLAIA